jgi:hypothetical protein
LSRKNSKVLLLLQHHNISTYWFFFFFFFSSSKISLGLGRNGSPNDYDFWSSDIWKGDVMWAHYSQLCFEQTSSPISPPPLNTTTLIKPMNEKEEEAPLEDSRIRRNHLARERHAARSKKQRVADANRRATHRVARSDAQIAADASRWATRRAVHSDVQIAADASWRVA